MDYCTAPNVTLKFDTMQTRLAANLSFVCYTLFVIACASAFVVYKRKFSTIRETLQVTFNAGGQMSLSLLASTIISQWTWAANLLGSSTAGIQYGFAGVYWYSASAAIQIILFSIVCMEMRIKAPGARTFLQIIQVRFDKKTHILFCIFAILTNFIVAATVLVGAVASISYTFDNISSEYAILLLIIPTFLFVFIGGLGGFFYVSYFTTLGILVVIIILFMRTFYSGQSSPNDVGDLYAIYNRFACIQIPNNPNQSFKTFLSFDALMSGIIGIVGNFGAVFIDQSYWQLNATCSPKKGSMAFIVAGFIWFFVPFVFGTTMSIAYVYLNSYSNTNILSSDDISSGVASPVVAGLMMGNNGTFLVNLIIICTGTIATGGEMLAITGIVINDLIPVYFKPFKPHLTNKDSLMCILCERLRGKIGTNKCVCESLNTCKMCEEDDEKLKYRVVERRSCLTHGEFRDFEDFLDTNKRFVMILAAFVMLIVSLLVYNINLSLNWLYSFMGIIVGPAVVPVTLSLFWARINSNSMFISQISGCVVGIVSWLVASAAIYGGIDMDKSGKLLSMLVGNVASIGTGGVLVIVLTLCTTQPQNVDQKLEIWEKTRDIDSPLLPWYEIYSSYMKIDEDANQLRPSLMQIQSELRRIKRASWIAAFSMTFFFIIVWPVVSVSFDDFSVVAFKFWLVIGQIFIFAAFIYFLLAPLLERYMVRLILVAKRSRDFIKINVPRPRRSRV